MAWQVLEFNIEPRLLHAVEPLLQAAGARSISWLADASMSASMPAAADSERMLRVEAMFDAGRSLAPLRELLTSVLSPTDGAGDGASAVSVRLLEDDVWERAWMDRFEAFRVGPLTVCPRWQDASSFAPPVLHLDPGRAFGSGSHETTRLCLQALVERTDLAGLEVIDYGCGSGILGLAAVLLGARRCRAVDIDEQALVATRDNAACNQVAERIVASEPAAMSAEQADLLLANILSGPLIELAPRLTRLLRPDGLLILSGMLVSQVGAVQAAWQSAVCFEPPRIDGDWACLVGRARGEAW